MPPGDFSPGGFLSGVVYHAPAANEQSTYPALLREIVSFLPSTIFVVHNSDEEF